MLVLWFISGIQKIVLKGHSDSVNSGMFRPFTHDFYSASGDRTVSAWDTKNGICMSTFFGHSSSINDVAVSWQVNFLSNCE